MRLHEITIVMVAVAVTCAAAAEQPPGKGKPAGGPRSRGG